jgi:hypothetical protein
MANMDAYIRLIAAIKPPDSEYARVAEFDQWRKQVAEGRDCFNLHKELFHTTLEKDTEQGTLQWVNFDQITIYVQLLEMQGPLN